jgi:hypothetical protein
VAYLLKSKHKSVSVINKLSKIQKGRRLLSPLHKQETIETNVKQRKCLSPRIVADDVISHSPIKLRTEQRFNLHFEHVDPSIKFRNALEEQQIHNYRS